ncbi:MAG TPA: tetratricopeptide repeat protein [Bryobacteraceae bacterium]|nr:tetratricopeptide repeat protein [Bryobacteraceae bacterium]
MTDREGAPGEAPVSPETAPAILTKLLGSPHFSNARRLREFLRFVVSKAAAGETARISEHLIAMEVYGRDADYDPAVDSIVRVEANRLRAKLRDYYEAEGRDDPVRLRLPADSYVPVLESAPPGTAAAPQRRTPLRLTLAVTLAAVTTMAALVPFGKRGGDARRAIAVLPFANTGGLSGKDYFSDGLTDQISGQIGRSGKLRVAARPSAEKFKDGDDIGRIGERLHVDLVLEGIVHFAGDRIGVATRLYNSHTGSQIWSRDFDRPASEVLVLQDEISSAVAGALQLRNGGTAAERTALGWTRDSGALDLYLQAHYLFNSRKPENLLKSVTLYNSAIQKDPQFALAYAGLAEAYVVLGANEDQDIAQTTALARQAAARALAIEPRLPDALLTQAATADHPDWATLERSYQAAIAANPSDANAHHWYGLNLLASGRFSEAEAEIRQAQLLDPLSLHIGADLAEVYYSSRRYQRAIEQAGRILELDHQQPQARLALAKSYEAVGRYADAKDILENLLKVKNCAAVMADLGHVYAVSGDPARAEGMFDSLTRLSKHRHVSPHHIAVIQAGLGRTSEALALLEMSYEQHDIGLAFLKVDPRWDPLRPDPRFQNLLRGMTLDK